MNPSRILIITYDYPPALSPRALRWSAIAEHWAAEGHRIEVVCARLGDLPAKERCNAVEVHRVGGGLIHRLRNRVAGSRSADLRGTKRPTIASALRGAAVRLNGLAWRRVRWPDYAALWYFTAARKALGLLRRGAYDALITSSHPFTDHLVGLRAKRSVPVLPWIIDVGDPFSFLEATPPNNQAFYRRLNYLAERRVFDTSDAISVTNEGTKRIYADLFPTAAGRIHVIPPLLRTEVGPQSTARVFPDDDRVRLAFVGRLYAGIRSPEPLLRVFNRLLDTHLGHRLELHLFGTLDGCERCFQPYQSLIGTKLLLHGPVDHGTARRAMAEADFLVNLGNTTSYQLPSKLVEYARTGVPILNFVNSPDDSSAVFFADHPAVLPLSAGAWSQGPNQWSKLLRFLEAPPHVDREWLRSWLQPFETDSIVRAYEALVDGTHRGIRCSVRAPVPHAFSFQDTGEQRRKPSCPSL